MLQSLIRREFLYWGSGAFLALVLFVTVLSMRYGEYLDTESKKVRGIIHKTSAMEKSNKDMEGLVGRLAPGEGGPAMAPREAILASLDEIKKRLRASSMSLSAFDERDGAVSIGVEIEAPFGDYDVFVRNVHYLESMSMPWFTMENVLITEGSDAYQVKLTGLALMPSKNVSRE
ncbi:MAG: hypothetical protein ACE5EZ_05435 [Thermodesulfobacteriota bacterium]